MKNAFYTALFILVLGNLGHFGLPWWALAPIAAMAAWLFPAAPAATFGTAFSAGTLLWYVNAALLNASNQGMLSTRVGLLFQGLQGWHLLLVTGLLGGILAGLGALTGLFARDLFVARQPKR